MNPKRSGQDKKNYHRIKSVPYTALAPIYNHVMRHVNYRQWAEYIQSLISKKNIKVQRILDVGCGTGNFIYEMNRMGYWIDGCDPSEAMIEYARTKNPGLSFWVDKLPRLVHSPSATYQLLTCLYDTMNYLPSLEVYGLALNRIYQLLQPGGYFVFDVVSEKFCQMYFHYADEEEVVNSDFAYSRKSYYKKATSQQVNHFTIYSPQGIFEEEHIQKILPYSKIKHLIIRETPFEIEAVFENFSFDEAGANSDRAHFILKRTTS
ncbi:MAG: class I SAM-dependent methyltransferase [bacterium]|nr:MAG: class I SAM-dependent methyltransferase [bacterium]